MPSKKVYIASKLHNSEEVFNLRFAWPRIHFTQRWDLMHGKIPDSKDFAGHFWIDDVDDIARSDYLLIYGKEEDKLRGALVEAGIAIALHIPVVAVGDHPDFSTWQFHHGVSRIESLQQALYRIEHS